MRTKDGVVSCLDSAGHLGGAPDKVASRWKALGPPNILFRFYKSQDHKQEQNYGQEAHFSVSTRDKGRVLGQLIA